MSGIAGILHLDRSPVDPSLLRRLTDFQRFRGPDARNVWIEGHIGFGHALLATTEESTREHQPLSLNGKTWIVADARIDGRRDLVAKLQARGCDRSGGASDTELILFAYEVWGESCLEHLLGDFSFGIWDSSRQRLFCARDQMGVRPLYYAYVGSQVIFSNTLDCIRQHPSVSDRLNDLAIADFLLFEGNQDLTATSFAEIQRLPPAHLATWSEDGLRISKYWSMPIDEPVFYRRMGDYVDRFSELLTDAVGDRLRTRRIAVFMSGGLDSTTLAATAKQLLGERFDNFDLQAFSKTHSLAPAEQHFASLVANHLGIPVHYHEWGDRAMDPNWERSSCSTPEPSSTPWHMLAYQDYFQQIASSSRVFLYGEGPDNALYFEWRPYVAYLLRQRRYLRLLGDTLRTIASQRRPPFWGRISRKMRRWGSPDQPRPSSFPDWVNPSLASRFKLHERWEEWLSPAPSVHPIRPQAYGSLLIPLWQTVFERNDAGWTQAAVEVRYPFMDLRMLRFLLAVPALPWCRSKYLIRRSMRGVLPRPVLRRPKSGLACASVMDRVGNLGLEPFVPVSGLNSYVTPERVPNKVSKDPWVLGGHLRVRSLNCWLQGSSKMAQNVGLEVLND